MSNIDPNWATQAVTNPATTAEQLAQIAAEYPQFHAAIAAHPNAYPGLRDWIARYSAQLSRSLGLPTSLDPAAPGVLPATETPVSPESSAIPARPTESAPTGLSPTNLSPSNPFGAPASVEPWERSGASNSLEQQGGFDQGGYQAVPGQTGYPGTPGQAGYPTIPGQAGYYPIGSGQAGYSAASGQGGYPTTPYGSMTQQGFTPAHSPRRSRLGIIIAAVVAAVLVVGGGATAWGVTASKAHNNNAASTTTRTSAPPYSAPSPSPSSPSASPSPTSPSTQSGDLAFTQCLSLVSAESEMTSHLSGFDVNVTGAAATAAIQNLQQAVDTFNGVANQITAPQLSSSVHNVSGDLNKMVSLLQAAVTANNKGDYSSAKSDVDQYNALLTPLQTDSDNLQTTCEAIITTGGAGGASGDSSSGSAA